MCFSVKLNFKCIKKDSGKYLPNNQHCKKFCVIFFWQGHLGSVNEIVIPESLGNRILSCGDDGSICVFEAGKKKGLIRTLRGISKSVFL